tara:strand:+ start:25 stop:456 length:432 start_codon:yes stop_codon:yes gene_type:complete
MAKAKKTMGRPPFEVTDEVLSNVTQYMSQGLTVDQCARMLGISKSTMMLHQANNSDFSDAIKSGKVRGITAVTNTLFNKAVEGDNTSMIFWLKNRGEGEWIEKVVTDNTNNNKVELDLSRISDEQISSLETAFGQLDLGASES